MFERYTEPARRAIFFARYEASRFGCSQIEAEHLLLGVLREDKALAIRFLASHASLEELRQSIVRRGNTGPGRSTSVDLPISPESKRALVHAAEESKRLHQKQITPAHLVLGLLREEKSFAAQLLRERGVNAESLREQVRQSEAPLAEERSASIAGLNRWLAEREAEGVWTVEETRAGNSIHFALCANEPKEAAPKEAGPKENGGDEDLTPAEKLTRIQVRIDFIVGQMERAIVNHEFEKARFYSDEERKERERQRRLCEQFSLELPPRVPLLCIAVIGDDLFSELRQRCEGYITQGVAEVWLLDPGLKRAWTITKADGLREFKSEILRFANPPLEMDLARIFE